MNVDDYVEEQSDVEDERYVLLVASPQALNKYICLALTE